MRCVTGGTGTQQIVTRRRAMGHDRGDLKAGRRDTAHLVRQLEASLVHDHGEMVSTER